MLPSGGGQRHLMEACIPAYSCLPLSLLLSRRARCAAVCSAYQHCTLVRQLVLRGDNAMQGYTGA